MHDLILLSLKKGGPSSGNGTGTGTGNNDGGLNINLDYPGEIPRPGILTDYDYNKLPFGSIPGCKSFFKYNGEHLIRLMTYPTSSMFIIFGPFADC